VLQRRGRSRPGLQRAPRPLCPAPGWRRPGVGGAADALTSARFSLSVGSRPGHRSKRRLRVRTLGQIFVVALTTSARSARTAAGRALELCPRGAHRHSRGAGRQLGRQEEQVSLHRLRRTSHDQVDMLSWCCVGNSTTPAAGRRIVDRAANPGRLNWARPDQSVMTGFEPAGLRPETKWRYQAFAHILGEELRRIQSTPPPYI